MQGRPRNQNIGHGHFASGGCWKYYSFFKFITQLFKAWWRDLSVYGYTLVTYSTIPTRTANKKCDTPMCWVQVPKPVSVELAYDVTRFVQVDAVVLLAHLHHELLTHLPVAPNIPQGWANHHDCRSSKTKQAEEEIYILVHRCLGHPVWRSTHLAVPLQIRQMVGGMPRNPAKYIWLTNPFYSAFWW